MKKLLSYLLLFIGSYMLLSCGATDSTTTYQISISASPAEGGTVSTSGGEYNEGETLEISATPTDGWRFVRWEGDHSGTSSMTTITADNDKDIQAIFTKREYELSVNTDGEGTVDEEIVQSKSTDYEYGTVVELTANPANGWEFVEWQGDLSTSENPQQITVDQAKGVTAVFEQTSASIKINIEGEGSVIKEPNQEEYEFGSTINLTASPENGWAFVEWQGDVSSSENPLEITLDQSKEISAIFEEQNIIFVDVNATGEKNGTTWENAYTGLREALTFANTDTEIWVAEGTYYPNIYRGSQSGDRDATFKLKSDVSIYGGFSGTETTREQRDWEKNETVLSGEINISDFADDNSCHVVTATEVSRSAILDGFTIEHGNSDGTCSNDYRGSAINIYYGSPTIKNSTIQNNVNDGVSVESGTYYIENKATPRFINCTFKNNENDGISIFGSFTATNISGSSFLDNGSAGIDIYNDLVRGSADSRSSLTINDSHFEGNNRRGINSTGGTLNIDNTTFDQNSTNINGGGAIITTGTDVTIFNSIFSNNRADTRTGGAINIRDNSGNVIIVNSIFINNQAGSAGAINGKARIINSTFFKNSAQSSGRSISGTGEIFNSIFWEISDHSIPQIGGDYFVRNSIIKGGLSDNIEDGGGNIDEDPLFIDQDISNGSFNLLLQNNSQGIDAGSNEPLDLDGNGDTTDDVPVDIEGNTRIQNGTVDMGAYETNSN